MNILIGIPWRAGTPERARNHTEVTTALRLALPSAEIRMFDTGHGVFNRAATRNAAARWALDHGYDALVLNDADTIAEPAALQAAVAACGDGRMHLPYTWFRSLTDDGTEMYLAGVAQALCPSTFEHKWATGGVMVCQPSAWFAAGGMDERFVGWGFEDTAARLCWDALLGETVRHPGLILHLWHPLDSVLGSPDWWHNRRLMDDYEQAKGDVGKIRLILSEKPGGYRPPGMSRTTP